VLELNRVHHLVLFCAWDGLDIATLLVGMDHVIGSGERFPLVPAIPAEAARQATLELLGIGAIRVSLVQRDVDPSDRWLSTPEAREALADPDVWNVKPRRRWNLKRPVPAAYSYEIVLTPAGEDLSKRAHELFGDEMDRTMKEARERSAAFHRKHPDFVEKNAQYLEELTRWVERGGKRPKRPRFD
jgi:hypothetical protein